MQLVLQSVQVCRTDNTCVVAELADTENCRTVGIYTIALTLYILLKRLCEIVALLADAAANKQHFRLEGVYNICKSAAQIV